MNLKRWEYFLKVCERGSLSRVAQKLDMSQPALSRQIAALEKEVGATLFIRTGRGLTLTAAGEIFRARAETIIEEIGRIPEEVVHAASTPSGRLAFGAPPFMGRILTGALAADFVKAHPHVRLRVRGAHSFQLREAILLRDIDVGILAAPMGHQDLHTEPLLTERLYLVGPEDGSPAPERPLSLHEVADRPLILTPRPDGLRTLIDTELARSGRRARVAVETEYAPIDDLIRLGVGYAILPFCGRINSPLTTFRWHPIEGLSIVWVMAWLETIAPSLAARHFIAMLTASVAASIQDGRWDASFLHPSRSPRSVA